MILEKVKEERIKKEKTKKHAERKGEKMKQNGLGIASLILGIIGILTSCIIVGVLFSIIGLIMGVMGLFQKNRKQGFCIAGIITSAVGMFLTLMVALLFIVSSDLENMAANESSSHIVTRPEENMAMYMPGDIVEVDGLQIQYVSAEEYIEYDEWNQPEEGKVIYKVTFEFANVSDKMVYVYYTDFDCYADNYAMESTYINSEYSNFATELSPGKKTKGEIYYEVPATANIVQLEYNPLFMEIEDMVYFRIK